MTPSSMSFERRYDDDSGVEKAVRYKESGLVGEIEFERHGQTCDFETSDLDWLIACLQKIKDETREETP